MGNLERAAGEENSISDIRRYFEDVGVGGKPLAQGEFIEFWKGCTEAERLEFKKVDLTQMH